MEVITEVGCKFCKATCSSPIIDGMAVFTCPYCMKNQSIKLDIPDAIIKAAEEGFDATDEFPEFSVSSIDEQEVPKRKYNKRSY